MATRAAHTALLCWALSSALLACRPPDDAALVRLDHMELHLGAASEAPPLGSSGWHPVAMPDHWTRERRSVATSGWYRAPVHLGRNLAGPGGAGLAVYVPGHSGRLVVVWDGERMGDSQPVDATPPHVKGPLLVALPARSTAPGEHRLELFFQGTPAMVDYVREPIVGDRAVLQPVFEAKQRASRDLPLDLAAAGVVLSLVLAVAYWPSIRESAWLAAGLFVWSLSVVGLYTPFPGLAERWFEPLRPALFHWAFPFFVIALHRFRGLHRPRLEAAIVSVWSLFTVLIFAVPLLFTYAVAVLWTAPSILLHLYVAVLLVGVARNATPSRAAFALLPMAGFALLLGHDIHGLVSEGGYAADQILGVYTVPVVMASLMGLFVLRARETLVESQQLNRELEERVTRKGHELEANYQKLREAERGRAVAAERERILRDMHDGLGGHLVSTLAMVESGHFEREELAEALRDSLDDLRLMVESLDPGDADLLSTLAVVRERLGPRLSRHGLHFQWNVEDLPDLPDLEPGGVLHVLRIVQEALGNIVKHAKASTITLETGTAAAPDGDATEVFLRIRDDGVGLPDGAVAGTDPALRSGRGLGHMFERARELGGRLTVESGAEGGTLVTLSIPTSGPG
jgi:signal transduction histidine kinase